MQNDKIVSIKYLQGARRAFQYRTSSKISAHALSPKRKEYATVPGKDESARRNSTVFIKPSQSKSEGKQSIEIYIHFFSNADGASTLSILYIHTFIKCSRINIVYMII